MSAHRLLTAGRAELRLQWRYGIAAATAFTTALWIALLRSLPGAGAIPLVVFLDLAVIGLFFLPALVLFEKDERTLAALVVTPLRPAEHLAARVGALAVLSVASTAVLAVGTGHARVLAGLLPGVVLLSVLVSLVAFVLVAPRAGILDYVLVAQVAALPLALPLLGYAVGFGAWWLFLVPTHGPLVLLHAAVSGAPPERLAAAVVSAAGWVAVAWLAALWAHRTHLAVGEGGPRGRPSRWARPPRRFRPGRDRRPGHPDRTAIGADGGLDGGGAVAVRGGVSRGRRWGGRARVLAAFARADGRLVRRDALLLELLVAPAVLAVPLRLAGPPAPAWVGARTGQDPAALALLALAFLFLLTTPFTAGVLVGLLLLDDRDGRVLEALRVTPLAVEGYVAYRAGLAAAVAVAGLLVWVPVSGLLPQGAFPAVVPALVLAGLSGALVALAVLGFARNKVEGLALLKVASPLVFLPIAGLVAEGPGWALLGVLPTHWPLQAFRAALEGGPWLVPVAVGAAHHLLLLGWLVRRGTAWTP